MATNQISTSPYLLSDSNQAAYRYNGELPPEESLEQQALNRRQHIANLLIQQGLSGAGTNKGQMVGRFYVPGSPVQGLADLAKIGVGAYGTYKNDEARGELADKNQQMLADAVANYKHATSAVPAVAGSPQAAPQASVAEAMAGPQSAPVPPPSMEAMPMGPPATPFAGSGYQMGPDESGWAPKGPIQDLNAPPSVPAPQQQVAQAMASQSPMQGPMSPGTPGRERTPEEKRQALIDLMASQHPQARGLADFLSKQDERIENRQMLHEEKQEALKARTEEKKQLTDIQQKQFEMTYENSSRNLDQQYQANKDRLNDARLSRADHTRLEEDQHRIERERLTLDKSKTEMGKVPPGYEKVEGGLKAIPGGPADTKLQGVLNLDTSMLQNSNASFDRLAESANQILNHPGLAGITGLRGAVPDVPGTQAADARALLNKLKSQVGFGVLQEMRNNSKSGGALGSVSDAEGKRLENNLASVESAQSIDQMKRELQGIVDYSTGAKDRLREAFNLKHKSGEPKASAPQPEGMTPTVPAFHDAEKQKRYEEFKKSHKP